MFPVRDKHGYRQEHLCKYRLVFVLFRFRFRFVCVYLICKVIIGFRTAATLDTAVQVWSAAALVVKLVVSIQAWHRMIFTYMFPVRDKHGYRQEHLCKYRLVFVLFRFRFRVVYVYLICKVRHLHAYQTKPQIIPGLHGGQWPRDELTGKTRQMICYRNAGSVTTAKLTYAFYSWDTTASAVEVVVVEAVVFTNMFPGGLYLRHVQEHDCKCLVVLGSRNGPTIAPKCLQNGSKMVPKWFQHSAHIYQKSTKNRKKIDQKPTKKPPKTVKYRSKLDPKSIKIETGD